MGNDILYEDDYFRLLSDGSYLIKKNLENVKGVLYAKLQLPGNDEEFIKDNNAYVNISAFTREMQKSFVSMYLCYTVYVQSGMRLNQGITNKEVLSTIARFGVDFKLAWVSE